MNLPEYIRFVGVKEFAARFDVTERATLSYMYRARFPNRRVAKRLMEEAEMTWADIYAEPPEEVA